MIILDRNFLKLFLAAVKAIKGKSESPVSTKYELYKALKIVIITKA